MKEERYCISIGMISKLIQNMEISKDKIQRIYMTKRNRNIKIILIGSLLQLVQMKYWLVLHLTYDITNIYSTSTLFWMCFHEWL